MENKKVKSVKSQRRNDWFAAINSNDYEKVDILINNGIDINIRDKDKNTALIIGVKTKNKKLIERLFDISNVQIFNLLYAWKKHQLTEQYIKKWRIQNIPNINAKNNNDETAISLALNSRCLDIIEMLMVQDNCYF